jgi:stress-induced morphogen
MNLGDEIASRIGAALPGAEISVQDTTGGGDHWAATVVSDAFAGKPLLQRHRMVYAALGELMHARIHALALTTDTPAERQR